MPKSLHKVKMFKSMQQDLSQMEDMVNQWLDENSGIEIIQLAQSEIESRTGRDTVVTILYSESPDL
jgi:ethanolamine utilization protein EutQ (cupin superfamily)